MIVSGIFFILLELVVIYEYFDLIVGVYVLGFIDFSFYKIVDEDDDYEIFLDYIGRVWFVVEYEWEIEKLLVILMKVKNFFI